MLRSKILYLISCKYKYNMNICATIITNTEIPELLVSKMGEWFPTIQTNMSNPVCPPPIIICKDNSEIIESKIEINQKTEEEHIEKFKLPINYLDKSKIHSLSDIIARDLELYPIVEKDNEVTEKTKEKEEKSMYDYLFQHDTINTSLFSRDLLPQWKNQFTTDTDFLLQTQEMIKTIPKIVDTEYEVPCTKIKEIWNGVKNDPTFMEKYGYLEWSVLERFNHSPNVLQAISLINILSPLISFFIPVFIVIFPFFLLKFKNIPITINEYIECLVDIAKNHFIGKAILCCKSWSIQSLFYVIGSLGLYLLQMYQNTMQCIRFYRNTQYINESLITMKEYVDDTITKMDRYYVKNKHLSKYTDFCKEMRLKRDVLLRLKEQLDTIHPFQCSIYKTTEIGYMLKCFYELHTNSEFEDAILYSMGFQGYLQQMYAICISVEKGTLGLARFTTASDIVDIDLDVEDVTEENEEKEEKEEEKEIPKIYIKDQFYPPHYTNHQCVKNDVNLDKKMIITGPNASGKTTFLKTTAINLIFSQQFGVGYYSDCCFVPYTHFHSYLNIPDTSGRDSLFQAESRRCKEILDIIQTTNKYTEKHFCIFDELYSGTNPVEATKSAYAFLKYVSKTYAENVDFLLTTHYVSICEKWNNKKDIIQNYKMGVIAKTKDTYHFTYKIEPGISKIQGALQILEDMSYPDEIIDTIRISEF